MCAAAARKGHLSILKYLHANGCPWDSDTCLQAALSGHLQVLNWMCALKNTAGVAPVWDQSVYHSVAMSRLPNRQEILDLLRAHKCPGAT